MVIGQKLRNRYQIIQKIGFGGFGETYLALDLDLPSTPQCVVKQLLPKDNSAQVFRTAQNLFNREARMLYRLGENQQIPRLYAYFSENGQFYLVQEFIEGHDLREEIIPKHPLSEKKIVHLLKEILEVLTIIHEEDIIHRDLKPSNIMRREKDGKLILIDFGSVKSLSGLTVTNSGETTLTFAIGSPGYMPSEQALGKPKLASDIYAVGMIGVQGITGVDPYQLPEDPITSEVMWEGLVPNLSQPLAKIINKMIAYDYRQRYQDAESALADLKKLKLKQPRAIKLPVSSKPISRGRFLQLAISGSAGALATLVIGSLFKRNLFLEKDAPISPFPQPPDVAVRSTSPSKDFVENLGNGIILEMVSIPGGKFLMGSPENELGRSYNESPQHSVTVSSFFIGKYPITQAQWQAIMGNSPSYFKSSSRPVETVSWQDSLEFCQKLSEKTGKIYRLPSESEWEYACRGGTQTKYFFGDNESQLIDYAWYADNSNLQTHRVGKKNSNPFGLYDLLGNVWEWCHDDYHDNYNDAPNDGRAWLTTGSIYKVCRGGAWYYLASSCRSASRNKFDSLYKDANIGLRVVLMAKI